MEQAECNAVKRCIALAVKHLHLETRSFYGKLAVFPDDVLLPFAALCTIFGDAVAEASEQLNQRQLIRIEVDRADGRWVRLHDLSLEFVRALAAKELPGG